MVFIKKIFLIISFLINDIVKFENIRQFGVFVDTLSVTSNIGNVSLFILTIGLSFNKLKHFRYSDFNGVIHLFRNYI